MNPSHPSSYLAFACLLATALGGTLAIQTFGHMLNLSFAPIALPLALLPAVGISYVYFFPLNKISALIGGASLIILAFLGILSRDWFDMTSDGMSYHLPAVQALLEGWNPFGGNTVLLWQNVYPSGIWAIEAAIASLFGSIETAKMLHIIWLFIALPVFLAGLKAQQRLKSTLHVLLAVLALFSPILFNQILTHYVDAMIYLAGMAFLGALMLVGISRRMNLLAALFMAISLTFIINAKLSGLYHGAALCMAAVLFRWIKTRSFPWKIALLLFATGIAATFIFGYRPYATNLIQYGSFVPFKSETFSGTQRPSNFAGLHGYERFTYSLFSTTGGDPRSPSQFKWPWEISMLEWQAAGWPDARTGGFGPFYTLGLLASFLWVAIALIKKLSPDPAMLMVGCLLLIESALFPESWWARYVPFAYSTPFLLILAFPVPASPTLRRLGVVIAGIFIVNTLLAETASVDFYQKEAAGFRTLVSELQSQPQGSVYLVPPPAADFDKYNHGYITMQRRFASMGIANTLQPLGTPCNHMAATLSEFKICY